MARNNRAPRRQGVVYGPVQPADRGSDASSLVGRIVGMLVVAGAVGVLTVGALAVMRGGGAAPVATSSPRGTAAAAESPPRATATPDRLATPTALPAPSTPAATPILTPLGTPLLSPAATPFELTVREGPGFVTFGTVEGARLRIANPQTTFGAEETIILSAHLTRPASSADLRLVVFRFDPESGTEERVAQYEVRPRVASAQIFLRRLNPEEALPGPGIYIVRYLRGTELMAEGFFRVRG